MMLSDIFTNATPGADGIWRTERQSPVSYGDEGHENCIGVEERSFWFAHRNRCIAAAIQRHPPDPALPFIDAGGGNGVVAAMIRGLGYRVVLVEPGASGIRNARGRGLTELVQASIADIKVTQGSLGAIGIFDVLEHIPDDAAALRSLHGMLAKGGRIYATVPAHRWLWSSADVDAGHFRRYTRRRLLRLLEACGFDVDLCTYFFWPLPAPMILLRGLPEALHLRARRPSRSRIASEHQHGGRLLEMILRPEATRLRLGRTIPWGASCIVVATRRDCARAS
jgi:SAM-dependent methyltransferase